ncbi:MAG TPA: uracil phosphoribosyltransferase [Longimicrobiales bacterium]|nr:uracil phosphoribosyltransferase [Longimicrobiales bacterium]
MTRTTTHPNLTVVGHPLVQHKMALLRDVSTSKKTFRELVEELSMLLAYEATKELPLQTVTVETPLERTEARRVAGKKVTLVPVLRAGLGMVDGVLRLMPSARVGHIGLYRDHATLEPVHYYFKIPGDAESREFIVLDPMLATGGSASAAVTALREGGAAAIRFMCLVAAPEGVERMRRDHPEVPVIAAALDRQLNEHGYILPGLGDAGDRLFGTK